MGILKAIYFIIEEKKRHVNIIFGVRTFSKVKTILKSFLANHCGAKVKRFCYYEALWLKFEYNVDEIIKITIYLNQCGT